MLEIVIQGRGGQGIVSLTEWISNLVFQSGLFVKSFPSYGAERRGAPIAGYIRISKTPISEIFSIQNPTIVCHLEEPKEKSLHEFKNSFMIYPQKKPQASDTLSHKFLTFTSNIFYDSLDKNFKPMNTFFLGILSGMLDFKESTCLKFLNDLDFKEIFKSTNEKVFKKGYHWVRENMNIGEILGILDETKD